MPTFKTRAHTIMMVPMTNMWTVVFLDPVELSLWYNCTEKSRYRVRKMVPTDAISVQKGKTFMRIDKGVHG